MHLNGDFVQLVVAQIKLGEVNQVTHLHGQGGHDIVTKVKNLEVFEVPNGLGEGLQFVAGQGQLLQARQLSNVIWEDEKVVVAGIKLGEHGEIEDFFNQGLHVVGAMLSQIKLTERMSSNKKTGKTNLRQRQLLEPSEVLNARRNGVGIQVVLAKIKHCEAGQLSDFLGKGSE